MLAVGDQGLPLGGSLANDQAAEVNLAEATLDWVWVPRRGRGRPRTRAHQVVADRGYDSQGLRMRLRRRGIRPCIPERQGKKSRPGVLLESGGLR